MGEVPQGEKLLDLSIEELMEVKVQSASRFVQKASRAPSAVTVITAEEISRYGWRTLGDALDTVGGLYSTNDRNYQYLGVRGFNRPGDYDTRVLLLIDGHRVNDNLFFTAQVGWDFLLDLELVDRIEIVRGPGSSLYGTNAFFGVVNVIPKKGKELKGLQISNQAGNQKWLKNRLSYGESAEGKSDLLIAGTTFSTEGEKSLFFPEWAQSGANDGISRKCDFESAQRGFFSWSRGDFSFMGGRNGRQKNIPTGAYGTFLNRPETWTYDEIGFLEARYRDSMGPNSGFQARLYYDLVVSKGTYSADYGIARDYQRGRRWGSELLFNHDLGTKSRIVWGAEFRKNTQQDQTNTLDSITMLDDKRTSKSHSFFFQDEYSLRPDLILNAGFRLDSISHFRNRTNPRFALIYSHPRRPVFKLLYGEAFRVPNVYEMYYDDGHQTMKKNLDLEPETIKSWELAVEHPLNPRFTGSLSVYKNAIRSLISQETDPNDGLLVFRNKNRVSAEGVEFEIRKMLEQGTTGKISFAIQRAKDIDTGEELTNSPKFLGKANISFPLFRGKTILGFEERYCSSRNTRNGNRTRAYYLTNLTLSRKSVWKNADLTLSVQNLFDGEYHDPAPEEMAPCFQVPQIGRTFQITLDTRY